MAALRSLELVSLTNYSRRILQRGPVNGVLWIVLMAFAIIVAGVGLTLAADIPWPGTTGNPFDPYEAILPGLPMSAARLDDCKPAFSIPEVGYEAEAIYCHITPDEGPIRLVSVNGSDGVIESVSFRMRGVRAGDLIEQWGHPDTLQVYRYSFAMTWKEGIYAMGAQQGRYSYWSPVQFVMRVDMELE